MLADFCLIEDISAEELRSYASSVFDIAVKDWRFKHAGDKKLNEIRAQCIEIIYNYIKAAKYTFADVFVHYGILTLDRCLNKRCF